MKIVYSCFNDLLEVNTTRVLSINVCTFLGLSSRVFPSLGEARIHTGMSLQMLPVLRKYAPGNEELSKVSKQVNGAGGAMVNVATCRRNGTGWEGGPVSELDTGPHFDPQNPHTKSHVRRCSL